MDFNYGTAPIAIVIAAYNVLKIPSHCADVQTHPITAYKIENIR